jgi:16S rRNA (adenine1518-N6/adenine1519-N6)-dimethyltransferase
MNEPLSPKSESLLSKTRFLLDHYDLQARKGLGQHFLVNSGILKNITKAAELSSSDLVIEVGPGIGVLTHALVEQAGYVIAVELDARMAKALEETLVPHTNYSIINKDILDLEPQDIIGQEQAKFPDEISNRSGYKLVANLPYYITQPIIRHFCEAKVKPRMMVVMVQKEVAQNIVAKPGDLRILAISVQFYGNAEIMGYVPAANFFPVPKVDSAILKITLYPKPRYKVTSEKNFFRIVRAGFCATRKQVANSLAQGLALPKPEVIFLLRKAGVSPQKRPETLTLEEWASLENIFAEANK